MATAEGDARLDVHRQRVDAVASDWRQGDVFRTDVLATPVVADLDSPLTPAALAAGDAPVDGDDRVKVVWHDDTEFVLVSQGCDIVEPSAGEPFIAVCPVITLDGQQTSAAAKGYMPGFAPVPSHGADQFADLGRVFTIEKSLLLNATRTARHATPRRSDCFEALSTATSHARRSPMSSRRRSSR